MTEPVAFPNAPITEAVLDIRVNARSDVDLARLAEFQTAVQDQFPTSVPLTDWKAGFQIELGSAQTTTQASVRPSGYMFQAADQTKIVQAKLSGFTFSKLKPYRNWNTFRDEASQLWLHYVDMVRPIDVARIALRYINRIEIPLPFEDYKEYILTIPEIAPGIPQGLAHFFMRLEIPYPDQLAIAVITQTIDQSDMPLEAIPLILDIDVFREVALDPRSEQLWHNFEILRNRKNEIFFNSITPKTQELFR